MSQPDRYYLTTPIYYVNAEPHIGNSYTTVAADVLKRYLQLFGNQAFFLTGTDEHGTKVAEAAEKEGLQPAEFCLRNSQRFKDSWKTLRIEYDRFIRTSDPAHEKVVREFVQKIYDKGYIYRGEYVGLYCNGCEKFMTEKDLTAEGLCPDHLTKPQLLKEKNYFFRLSQFLEPVRQKIETGELRIIPEMRRNEVLGLFKQNLEDISISREKVKWGISLPFDESQVIYVWIDALINYISAIGYPDRPEFEMWWNEARIIHLMAKDILKFHCIVWPAMLMAAEVKLPETIMIHGYLNLESHKISKTLGNIIRPADMIGWFGLDAARYLLLNMCAFGSDSDIRIEDFYTKYNADLANNYGNLISRTFKMIARDLGGMLPSGNNGNMPEIIREGYRTCEKIRGKLAEVQIKAIADDILLYLNRLNTYFDEKKPWVLARERRLEELGTILHEILCGISIATALLSPFLIEKTQTVIKALFGPAASACELLRNPDRLPHFAPRLEAPDENLFPRLQMPAEAVQTEQSGTADNLLGIEDFAKIDLRVAEVLQAERVPKADKLLTLQIQIGGEKRQIVAGIAQHYRPEDLIGRKIIVVVNLKPAVLRGIESNGMLLAARGGQKLALLTVDQDLPSGAKIS